MESPHNLATRSPRGNSAPSLMELRVKSLTQTGVTYRVRYANRKWTCECPDARHRNRRCKHAVILGLLGPKCVSELAASKGGSQ